MNLDNLKILDDAGLNLDQHTVKIITTVAGVIGDCLISYGLPQDKAMPLMIVVTLLTGLLVVGISHVQANKYKAQGNVAAATLTSAKPDTQVNVGSDVQNPAAPSPVAPKPAATPATLTLTNAQLQAYGDRVAQVALTRFLNTPKPAPTPSVEQITDAVHAAG